MPNHTPDELIEIFRAAGLSDDLIRTITEGSVTGRGGGQRRNVEELKESALELAQQKRTLAQQTGELSPETLQDYARNFFLPQIAQQYSPAAQQAVGGLRLRAARAGLGETPFALTSEAGLRGQLGTNMVQEAFQRALQLGQLRQGVQSGAASLLGQQQSPFLLDLLGAGKEAFGTFATYKALQGQRQPGVPFALPQAPQNQFQIPNQQSFFPTLR